MISYDMPGIAGRSNAVALATLRVDMIADLVCPWSYLGKRRLDQALAAVRGPSIVNWNPYQLNPGIPRAGMSIEDYLSSKFGDAKSLRPGFGELTAAGETEGIHFRFDQLRRVPNSLDAHRLMLYAASQGVAVPDMAESLFRRFFELGEDISNRDVLLSAGAENGLEHDGIVRMLEDDETRRKVLAEEAQLRKSGVSGVPNFLVNDRLFVMGAQPAATLIDAFDRAMFGEDDEQQPARPLH